MPSLIPFQFGQSEVRVSVGDDGQPWFNANDVCEVLQFGNARQALESHVDAEDVQKLDTLTAGGPQQANYVNESGLYALIFGSTKPEAKKFKRWVTSEVLPAIRKTGTYSTPTATEPRDPHLKLKELTKIYYRYLGPKKDITLDNAMQTCQWAQDLLGIVRNELVKARQELDKQAEVLASLHFPCTPEQDKAQVYYAQHGVNKAVYYMVMMVLPKLCNDFTDLCDFDAVKELRRRIT